MVTGLVLLSIIIFDFIIFIYLQQGLNNTLFSLVLLTHLYFFTCAIWIMSPGFLGRGSFRGGVGGLSIFIDGGLSVFFDTGLAKGIILV